MTLFNHGANIDTRDKRGKTPLISALQRGNELRIVLEITTRHRREAEKRFEALKENFTVEKYTHDFDLICKQLFNEYGWDRNRIEKLKMLEAISLAFPDLRGLYKTEGYKHDGSEQYSWINKDTILTSFWNNSENIERYPEILPINTIRNRIAEYSKKIGEMESQLSNIDECILMLIRQGATVNTTDSTGNIPLLLALSNPSNDILSTLVSKGVDVNVSAKWIGSALDYAISMKYESKVEILRKAGAKESPKK